MHGCCCRFCGASLRAVMVDLGMSQLANAYLTAEQLHQMEPFYPLRVHVWGSGLGGHRDGSGGGAFAAGDRAQDD